MAGKRTLFYVWLAAGYHFIFNGFILSVMGEMTVKRGAVCLMVQAVSTVPLFWFALDAFRIKDALQKSCLLAVPAIYAAHLSAAFLLWKFDMSGWHPGWNILNWQLAVSAFELPLIAALGLSAYHPARDTPCSPTHPSM